LGTVVPAIELRPVAGEDRPLGRRRRAVVARKVLRAAAHASVSSHVDARCRATNRESATPSSRHQLGQGRRMRWKGKRPTVRGVVMNRSITRTWW